MRVDVVMPQLGESVIEGVVVKWLVKVGDTVARDQSLLEISTDKVDAEIPSPEAGRIVEILAKEGETVPIQEILCRIETEKVADAPPPPPEKWDEEEEGFPGAMARKTGPPIPTAPPAEPPKEIAKPVPPPPAKEGVRVRISPVVAKMAAEYGLDISRIPGTGIDGRVTKKDVEEYIARGGKEAAAAPTPKAKPAPPPSPPPAKPALPRGAKVTPEGDQVIPFTPIRKTIAEHMVMSKRTSPHVHTFAEVDMHRVVTFREEKKKEGISLTYLPFVIRAAIEAIREFPVLNAQVVKESTVIKKAIHISVAVDTERGLIVPVIRNADEKSLLGLAKAVD
ncbi:MAG: 2-oxo acid dehydrogenase subunit E2, partial [Deltaproteobacteria bacterium]|nr:2-oxo acid dehydrogenase subunit E2 [Deltaproteobacteria bacterium]